MSAVHGPDDPRTSPIAPPVEPEVEDQPHGRSDAARTEDPMSSSPHEPAEPTGPAIGTLAWGLVVLAVAGVLLVREVTDLTVDLSYALPVGMVALGLLLVVGAVVTGIRRR